MRGTGAAPGLGPDDRIATGPLIEKALFGGPWWRSEGAAAVSGTGRCWTWKALYRDVHTLASELLRQADPGGRVMVDLAIGYHSIVVPLACWRAGLAYVPIKEGWPASMTTAVAATVKPATSLDEAAVSGLLCKDTGARPALDLTREATVFFTSGSTSEPKAVVNDLRSLMIGANWLADLLRLEPGSHVPVLYCPGDSVNLKVQVLPALLRGATLVLQDDPHVGSFDEAEAEAYATVFSVPGHPITHAVVSAADAGFLVDAIEKHCCKPIEVLRQLQAVYTTGSGLNPNMAAQMRAALPQAQLGQLYGHTEAGAIAFAKDEPGPEPVYHPFGGVEIAVGAGEEALPPGTVGPVAIRAPSLMSNYLGAEDPPDQWFVTGDRGVINPDGGLVLRGRARNTINNDGDEVSPARFLDALRRLEGIDESCVIAIPHPFLGERAAVLCRGRGVDLEAIVEAIIQDHSLATILGAVVGVDAFPRLAGRPKIDQQSLRSYFEERPLPFENGPAPEVFVLEWSGDLTSPWHVLAQVDLSAFEKRSNAG